MDGDVTLSSYVAVVVSSSHVEGGTRVGEVSG